ncbi:hypothetical protein EDC96DRAFT_232232 [Choanephora cucurbitarum]|nr:hypothetical protein EDC96DRAFT_232232 [Choanephora cucurbitarum]
MYGKKRGLVLKELYTTVAFFFPFFSFFYLQNRDYINTVMLGCSISFFSFSGCFFFIAFAMFIPSVICSLASCFLVVFTV